MIKLSDTQRVLLSSASQREDGSVLPLPASLANAGSRIDKSLAGLLTRSLVTERETTIAAAVHRADGDLCYGLFITPEGSAAIGLDDGDQGEGEVDPAALPPPSSPPAASLPKAPTKTAAVIALLQRPQGATLPELIAATTWLPHTTRAALTGLRKKGHAIARSKRDDATCYRITATS